MEEYPDLRNLTIAEQKEFWSRSLKQVDALTLEAYINCVAEPESEAERKTYEIRVKQQSRLRRTHQEWLKTVSEEEDAKE